MKSHFFRLILCLILCNQLSAQTDTVRYKNYKAFTDFVMANYKSKYPGLDFFKYKLVGTPISIYDMHKGDTLDSVLTAISYLTALNEIDISNFRSHPQLNAQYVIDKMIEGSSGGVVPISVALVEYNDFKDSAIFLQTIGWNGKQLTDNSPDGFYPFSKKLFIASSALNQAFEASKVRFFFDESLFLTNTDAGSVTDFSIDYADGRGFQPMVAGETTAIEYDSPGEKTLRVKLSCKGKTLYSSFKITILSQEAAEKVAAQHSTSSCSTAPQLPTGGPYPISTTKLGTYVSGEYAVWHATCNSSGQIRKPYIISAGFNPGNGKQLTGNIFPNFLNFILNNITISLPDGGWNGDWRGLYYETYNGGYNKRFSPTEAGQCNEGSDNGDRLLDRLRDEGYDIIILRYSNGTDYAIHNAALFMELVEQINQQKFANGYYFENVVSGYSAGGIATKLALSLMESRYKQGLGPHPHTKLWVSIETENQGANVPLGLQHYFRFQKDPSNLLRPLLIPINIFQVSADAINAVVSTLSYNYNNNPTGNELTRYMAAAADGQHPDRTNLLNTFASIPYNTMNGYPEFCRRIGVSQGSGLGYTIPHSQPEILDTRLMSGSFGFTATSVPSDCGGDYTWHFPRSEKRMTSRWWSAVNGYNLFDGKIIHDETITVFPMLCAQNILTGWNCVCVGPYTNGASYMIIGEEHSGAPTPANYDDVPASTQAAHIEAYTQSAYPFYNSFLAGVSGDAFAHRDDQLHGFAPTVSTLDLHDPTTGTPLDNFTAAGNLNLFNINKSPTGILTSESDLRYGFPYLNYPANHYNITPYDAIYSIGNNNGAYSDGSPKLRNQFHVEDPQSMMGDFISRVEVAPENLFLTNQLIGQSALSFTGYNGGYAAEFEARHKIITGETDNQGNTIYSLYSNKDYLTPAGEFEISPGAKAILHGGDQVELLPGTSIASGAELAAYIQDYNCPDALYRAQENKPRKNSAEQSSATNYSPETALMSKNVSTNKARLEIRPNPNNGIFELKNEAEENSSVLLITDISGKLVKNIEIQNDRFQELNLQDLENGIYLVTVINKNHKTHTKLIISK